MSDFKDYHTNTDSFLGSNSFSPADDQRPRTPSLTYSETIDLWSHATLLFHNLEWEQALSTHRRILRQCGTDVRKDSLWFNIGAIRAVLGEYYLAAEAYAKAINYEPDSAVGWYCLGISLFELNAFRNAKKAFEKCLRSFGAEERIDYRGQGLGFVLDKTRVEWNCRQALLEKNYNKARAPLVLDRHLGLNTMPAGTLFEPPSFGNDDNLETNERAASSPKPSSEPRSTPSNSDNLRRVIQTLLLRQPKQSARFEHSNPRLEALEEVTSSDPEIHTEAVISILAPSVLAGSCPTQQRRITFEPQYTSQDGQSRSLPSKPSTWPRSAKPPAPLPFVTAKDLSDINTEPWRSDSAQTRPRNRSTPQASAAAQPSTGVVYHEGPIKSTEYIPTTANIDAFMQTTPMALMQEPPSCNIQPADIPAPLSVPFRPQAPPIRPASASPTSIYSRPFHSPPQHDRDPLPAPTTPSGPKPTSAATQTWLDETFPPPRWDSLPAHLRPPRRPSRYQHRSRERRQHPSTSVNTSGSTRLTDEDRHIKPPTPFATSFPNEDPNLDAALLRPPERHRDSTASMDSFAIIGMGRQAARRDEGVGWVRGVGSGTAGEEARPPDDSREQRSGKGKERGKTRWPGLGSRKGR